MNKFMSRFLKDESGATAIEYGLIAAGIAVVIIAAVNTVGSELTGTFEEVSDVARELTRKRFRVESSSTTFEANSSESAGRLQRRPAFLQMLEGKSEQ